MSTEARIIDLSKTEYALLPHRIPTVLSAIPINCLPFPLASLR